MLVNELHQGGIRALLDWDNTIFDDMTVPASVNAEDVIDRIIFKYGDAPLFSPDPAVMKYYIKSWSRRRLKLWQRYEAAIREEYDPLENYNRVEERSETRSGTLEHSGTISTDDSGTITTADTGTVGVVGNETSTSQRAADNSELWSNYDKNITDTTGTTTNNLQREEERDLERSESRNLTDESESSLEMESRIHGNIGVTTSQQMLNSELDLIPRLDLVDYIADDWHAEFNLYIYV